MELNPHPNINLIEKYFSGFSIAAIRIHSWAEIFFISTLTLTVQ